MAEIKTACFINVCVCKAKMDQYEAIIDITDQVIEFAPRNLKCWYWRGKALLVLDEYSDSIKCFKKALEIDPNHGPSKLELA